MASTLQSELYPGYRFISALFTDVDNCSELRKGVMTGVFEATLLNPAMILDHFQVIVAANRAIHLHKHGRMVTKNVHSEILYCLSPTKNISDSFNKFGTSDSDRAVLVVIVNDADGSMLKAVQGLVKGNLVQIEMLTEMADINKIKKVYKLSDAELSISSHLDGVVSRIASKEIVTI